MKKIILLLFILAFSCSVATGFLSLPSAAAEQAGQLEGLQSQSEIIETAPDELTVLFINVGKADAMLIQYADRAYMIDTGHKSSVPSLFGALNLFGVDRLDGVFLTHTHGDHIGGMVALASNYDVSSLYSSIYSQNRKNGENKIEELARDLSLPHQKLKAGDRIAFTKDVYFDVLGPLTFNRDDDNDNSLVLKLTAFGRTLLFMGDAQFAEEESLMRANSELKADILKVGNHGNPDATLEAFADAVSPKYVIISTNTQVDTDSANERVLAALGEAEIFITQYFRTGVLLKLTKNGSIMISDPQPPNPHFQIDITDIDRDNQTVTLINKGTNVNISGFVLFSQRGSEFFVFPSGSHLASGQTVSVSTSPGADYLWPSEEVVWHRKKQDSALLYDNFGNILARND